VGRSADSDRRGRGSRAFRHRAVLPARRRSSAIRGGLGRSAETRAATSFRPARGRGTGARRAAIVLTRITRSVRSKLLLGVLATTGLALLITGAVVAYHDLRSFRDSLVTDITALADILGLAATPALVFDDP